MVWNMVSVVSDASHPTATIWHCRAPVDCLSHDKVTQEFLFVVFSETRVGEHVSCRPKRVVSVSAQCM